MWEKNVAISTKKCHPHFSDVTFSPDPPKKTDEESEDEDDPDNPKEGLGILDGGGGGYVEK